MRIVGLGASAGGMEALIALLSELPDNTGAAYVLILHLSPDHNSIMDELLAKYTKMPILVVEEVTPLQPNHIYIISKDKNLTLDRGMLITHPRQSRESLNLPIDQFFHSLGKSLKEQAIGVILSGTGTDGSRGVRTIKEAGGLVLVQSPDSAKFDGMPRTVIRLHLADRILAPAELAHMLTDILKWPENENNTDLLADLNGGSAKPYLQRILQEILTSTGLDFTGYREATLNRRLANRVLLHRLNDPEQYLEILKNEEEEAFSLHKDFLIGVTRFFRDPPAFETLEKVILPQIFENRQKEDTVRIWVPACSTGEEAYSIGLIIARYLREHQSDCDYKIFGTDVDSTAIKLASEGAFPHNSAADIPDDLLMEYFIKEADFYRIRTVLRDKMLFAVHNLLSDPPFIHMDLISCRNALIYFKPAAQRSVLSTFHFALNPAGHLFLGPSESLGEVKHAYSQVNKKWNIFQKKENTQLPYGSRQRSSPGQFLKQVEEKVRKRPTPTRNISTATVDAEDPFTRYLLNRFAPTAIFVNADLDIIYLQGDVELVLSFPKGASGFNLQHMLAPEQAVIFKKGISKSLESDTALLYQNVTITKEGKSQNLDVRFHKVAFAGQDNPTVLVELRIKSDAPPTPQEEGFESESYVTDELKILRDELAKAKSNRHELVNKLESTNEELQASNRELMAANEELQSTNEELQSVNEELYTVNNELQIKNEHLTTVNNDIKNLLKSTEIGTIFLDADLRIRRFTPAIRQQFNLLETDIGRSITHFSSTFENLDIAQISRRVYETLDNFEAEVTDRQGNHYLLRILPYRTDKDLIKGLVINFVDVNELMKVKEQIATFAKKFQAIFQYSREIIMVLEKDGTVRRINSPFGPYRTEDLLGKNLLEQLPEHHRQALRSVMDHTYRKREPQDIELQFTDAEGQSSFFKGCLIPVVDEGATEEAIDACIIIWQDISKHRLEQQQMENAVREYESFMDNAVHQIILVDEQGLIKHINFIRFRQLEKAELIGRRIFDFVNEDQGRQFAKAIKQVFAGALSERITYDMQLKDGSVKHIELIGTPVIINDRIKYAALIVNVKEE